MVTEKDSSGNTIGFKFFNNRTDKMKVFLEKKIVGTIVRETEGWVYSPKGSKLKGDYFATLNEVMCSIIGDTIK